MSVSRAARARLGVALCVALTLTAGPLLTAAPAASQPLGAVDRFEVAPPSPFPVDVLKGEREARASDALQLTTPGATSVVRLADAAGTDLGSDGFPDAPEPRFGGRTRLNPVATTDAGRLTAPFAERTLSLSLVRGGYTIEGGPVLSLTSTSDVAEAPGYTTLAETVDRPVPGRTYLVRTGQPLPYAAGGQPGALVDAARSDVDPMPVAGVSADHPDLVAQWTVVDRGVSGGGDPQIGLVDRENGSCLTVFDRSPAFGVAGLATDACEEGRPDQLFEVRPPLDGGSGSSLYNAFGRGSVTFSDGISDISPLGGVALETPGSFVASPPAAYTWRWQEVQQPTPIPPSTAFPVDDRADVPFDLAVGDLDAEPAEFGLPRDEAVVAHGRDGRLVLTVVDYEAAGDALLVTTVDTGAPIGSASSGGPYAPVAVDTVDLDADGRGEVVVSYVDPANQVQVLVARYLPDGGGRSLQVLGPAQPLGLTVAGDAAYPGDAAAADFDGDGTSEVAWVGADAANGRLPTVATAAVAVDGSTVVVDPRTRRALSGAPVVPNGGPGFNARIRAESGQFQPVLPGSGPRQLAVTWEDTDGAHLDVVTTTVTPSATSIFPQPVDTPQVVGSAGVSLAVGGFATAGGADDARWGVAVSAVGGPAPDGTVTLVQPTEPGTAPSVGTVPAAGGAGPPAGLELTAYDRRGESLVLGEPLVFSVQDLDGLLQVAAAPPAHSDWLGGQFVNVSRNEDLYLDVTRSAAGEYTSQTSQEADQSYGVTTAGDVTATVKEGLPVVEKAAASLEVSADFDDTWATTGQQLAGSGQSVEASIETRTADDDIVNAVVQNFQVTRYPVLSTRTWNRTDAAASGCESGCYGYWDVVLPGEPTTINGSGKSWDFFSPPWENGNALSYPVLSGGAAPVPLSDAGPFTYTGTDGQPRTTTGALLNEQLSVTSNKTQLDLDLGNEESSGTGETSSRAWNFDLDLKATASATYKIPLIAKVSAAGELAAGFNTAKSFVGSQTGSTSNTHESSFELSVPAVEGDLGYRFGVAYYYGTDGAARVTYGVDLQSDAQSREFWSAGYGRSADPALNLPNRSLLAYNSSGTLLNRVEWSPLASRQELRGFTARMPYSDDAATSGATYAAAPRPGDPVVFDVEVANYSFVAVEDDLTVDFVAVPVDADGLEVVGDPVEIGRQVVSSPDPRSSVLGPQGHVTVSSPVWTARGAADGAGQDWRIFAVLDRDDTIEDEVHELAGTGTDGCPPDTIQGGRALVDPLTGEPETLACGQNNQGYGELSVIPADGAVPPGTLGAAARTGTADVGLTGAGVLTDDRATLRLDERSPVPQVATGQTTAVVIRADALRTSAAHQTVVVYDGPPEDGDVVAVTRLRGVSGDGTSATGFEFTPTRDGVHELHAVLLPTEETGGDRGLVVRVDAVGDGAVEAPAGPTTPGASPAPGAVGDGDGSTAGTGTASSRGGLASTGLDGRLLALLALGGATLVGLGIVVRRAGSGRPPT